MSRLFGEKHNHRRPQWGARLPHVSSHVLAFELCIHSDMFGTRAHFTRQTPRNLRLSHVMRHRHSDTFGTRTHFTRRTPIKDFFLAHPGHSVLDTTTAGR